MPRNRVSHQPSLNAMNLEISNGIKQRKCMFWLVKLVQGSFTCETPCKENLAICVPYASAMTSLPFVGFDIL